MALVKVSGDQNTLFEIDEALNRIMTGKYGVCEATGQPIPTARLKAIPWTRFVKEEETRLEQTRRIQPVNLGTLGSVRGVVSGDLEESELEEAKEVPIAADETFHPVVRRQEPMETK
jgi:hypothetical protein